MGDDDSNLVITVCDLDDVPAVIQGTEEALGVAEPEGGGDGTPHLQVRQSSAILTQDSRGPGRVVTKSRRT